MKFNTIRDVLFYYNGIFNYDRFEFHHSFTHERNGNLSSEKYVIIDKQNNDEVYTWNNNVNLDLMVESIDNYLKPYLREDKINQILN